MKTPGQKQERLKQALRKAYQEKETIEVGLRWRTRLMAEVREIGPIQPAPGFLPSFQTLVWRLAAVTSPLALILIVVVALIGFDVASSYDAVQTLVNSVEELTLSTIFST
jgi:hypothetical protein